jgi:hypothetical protein
MPIHAPGPTLFSSIPFKHLGGKGHGGGHDVNASLNLTAMVDMMTMLVVFLLMTFSATGEILMVQKGLVLPDSETKMQLLRAPIVTITKDAITFNGEPMADPRTILAEQGGIEKKLIDLDARLRAEKAKYWQEYANAPPELKRQMDGINPMTSKPDPTYTLAGRLIMQADKDIDAKVINRVLVTCYGDPGDPLYPNVMFAVNQRKRK